MLEGLGLLVGHLIGDYVAQNDWMAANKANSLPETLRCSEGINAPQERIDELVRIDGQRRAANAGHLACTVHCLCYTLAVWSCSFWWMPWWGLVACFVAHWPIDRFRLARWWMVNVSGQSAFATGALSPWSVIVVDNTAHLATLLGIGALVKP